MSRRITAGLALSRSHVQPYSTVVSRGCARTGPSHALVEGWIQIGCLLFPASQPYARKGIIPCAGQREDHTRGGCGEAGGKGVSVCFWHVLVLAGAACSASCFKGRLIPLRTHEADAVTYERKKGGCKEICGVPCRHRPFLTAWVCSHITCSGAVKDHNGCGNYLVTYCNFKEKCQPYGLQQASTLHMRPQLAAKCNPTATCAKVQACVAKVQRTLACSNA